MTGGFIVNLETVKYMEKDDSNPLTPSIVYHFIDGTEYKKEFPNSNHAARNEVWAAMTTYFMMRNLALAERWGIKELEKRGIIDE